MRHSRTHVLIAGGNFIMLVMTAASSIFEGFSVELPRFLSALREHNSKEWFSVHRAEYDNYLLGPAREFVIGLGDLLHERLGQDIHAEPKVYGSILPINRDTRFVADKTPYKTQL